MRCFSMFFACLLLLSWMTPVKASDMSVRGLSVDAPSMQNLDRFLKFIDEELGPNRINTLVLMVNYNYRFTSRPELANPRAIGREEAQMIAAVCEKHGIRIVPLINLLGHQSWAENTGKLLQVYPEFNETPDIKPQELKWPNPDGYYCFSYCPLHPEVHAVVFPLVDEVVHDFNARDFHAGMDEVFYLAHESCPRCNGRNKAELFAGELTKIRNHLADSGAKLWIWGDRLLDGDQTGVGEWEGACNETAPAIDLVPNDIMICDWHYDRAETTAPIFAAKGFDVISCFWKKPNVTEDQWKAVEMYRDFSNERMAARYQGLMQTVWSGSERFLNEYARENTDPDKESEAASFRKFMDLINCPR